MLTGPRPPAVIGRPAGAGLTRHRGRRRRPSARPGRRRLIRCGRAPDVMLDRLMALHPKIIDLTLDRMQRLLAALGHPQDAAAPGDPYRRHQRQGLDPGDDPRRARGCGRAGSRLYLAASGPVPRTHPAGRRADRRGCVLAELLDECEAREWWRADHLFRDHDRRGASGLRADAGGVDAARGRSRRAARRDQRRRATGADGDHAGLRRPPALSRRDAARDRGREGGDPQARRALHRRPAGRRRRSR